MEPRSILVADADNARREQLVTFLRGAGLHATGVAAAAAVRFALRGLLDCGLVLVHTADPHWGTGCGGFVEMCEAERALVLVYMDGLRTEAVRSAFRAGVADIHDLREGGEKLLQAVQGALGQARSWTSRVNERNHLQRTLAESTERLRAASLDLERSYDITLEAMGDALDLRDAETEGHSKRVTAYTIELARAMRVSPADLRTIARGAYLHDIGKIATPDAILLKPGKLTPDEMAVMREHCQRGYDMVCKIPFLADAAEIVLAHQEAFDGSGYPRGLRGEEIPLGARIFAIADTMDAMTSDRPYRKGMSFESAFEEIARCRGRQFDPHIVDVFLAQRPETWSRIRASVVPELGTGEIFRAAA